MVCRKLMSNIEAERFDLPLPSHSLINFYNRAGPSAEKKWKRRRAEERTALVEFLIDDVGISSFPVLVDCFTVCSRCVFVPASN